MSSMRRSFAEPRAGSIIDDEAAIETFSAGGDSLFDSFPFEDINVPPGVDGLDTAEPNKVDDIVNPLGPKPKSLGRLRFASLPDAHQIVDWILGRNLMLQEHRQSTEWLPEAGDIKDATAKDEGEEPLDARQHTGDDFIDIGDVQDICPACTTSYCQAVDSIPFRTSLKLGYNDPERHIWLIGDKFVMTEKVDDEGLEGADVALNLAIELLRKSTRVPVPHIIAGWKEDGKVITITEQTPGQRLYDIWWDLRESEKERIAKQVARHIDQWRRLTADRISSLGGGAVRHNEHLFGTRPNGFGPFGSDEQLWDSIYRGLKRNNVEEEVIQILREYMPESAPCVFTHGDLSSTNILIHNGRVSSILGFDNAACLPVWAEYVAAHFCYCEEDEQWKAMLSRHMKSYARAKDWWSLWTAVEKDASRKHIGMLTARCRRWRWRRPPKEKRPFDPELLVKEKTQPDASYQDLMPEPQQQQSRQSGSEARKKHIPYRAALSRRLLKGRHFSELLNDLDWESVVQFQSEIDQMLEADLEDDEGDVEYDVEGDVEYDVEGDVDDDAEDGEFPIMEEGRGVEGSEVRNRGWSGVGRSAEETIEIDELEAKRAEIEKWLSENERERISLRPLLLQRLSGERQVTPQHPSSSARDPPWRERRRSFERAGNVVKGLRPFSLPQSLLSEGTKQKLKEIDRKGERQDGDDTRERLLEETLRSLESRRADSGGDSGDTAESVTPRSSQRQSPGSESTRMSIFLERSRPGALYMALVNAAAEGMSRQSRRNTAEEQESVEAHASGASS